MEEEFDLLVRKLKYLIEMGNGETILEIGAGEGLFEIGLLKMSFLYFINFFLMYRRCWKWS